MRLLVNCYSSDGDAVLCKYAIVNINLDALKKRAALARDLSSKDTGARQVKFVDVSADFYEGYLDPSDLPLTMDQLAKFARHQYVAVPSCFQMPDLDFDELRTEGNVVCIMPRAVYPDDDLVYWEGAVRRADVRVETLQIPLAALL